MVESVRLAQTGSVDAFAQLVNETRNLVTSTALAITYDVHASEDVAQQTYLDVWQQLAVLKSPDSFLPWLRQITRNKAKNYLRDNKVTRTVSTLDESGAAESSESNLIASLESDLARQQTEQTLITMLEALAPDNRDILILYYREEQSTAQVAKLMDLSEANVRQRLSRLRASLKQELLQKLADEVVRTAPGVLFTAGVTSAIGGSLPASAAAATLVNSSLGNSSLSGFVTKCLALLSGALVGGMAAIAAILLASKIMQRKLSDEEQKRFIKRYSRGQIIWVAVSILCFALSYELTTGWIAPVSVYSLFLLGMVMQQYRLMKYFKLSCPGMLNKGQLAGWAGLFLGATAGFAGTIIGLINSGRMLL